MSMIQRTETVVELCLKQNPGSEGVLPGSS
jgi:hypothetical protein